MVVCILLSNQPIRGNQRRIHRDFRTVSPHRSFNNVLTLEHPGQRVTREDVPENLLHYFPQKPSTGIGTSVTSISGVGLPAPDTTPLT
jgi:hypothetical protein